MRLLLKCVTSNEFTEGYEYAVVDLDPDLANLILRRIETFNWLFKIDRADGLHELRFHDLSAQYLNDDRSDDDYSVNSDNHYQPAEETFDDIVSGMIEQEFAQLPDGFDIPLHWIARSEGDYMVIRNQGTSEPRFGVCWVCRPKHSDDHVETADIDVETLKLAARGCHLPNSGSTAKAIVEGADGTV